jgi:hypothetical protein
VSGPSWETGDSRLSDLLCVLEDRHQVTHIISLTQSLYLSFSSIGQDYVGKTDFSLPHH